MKKVLAFILAVFMLLPSFLVYAQENAKIKITLNIEDEPVIPIEKDAEFNLYINGNTHIAGLVKPVGEDKVEIEFDLPDHKDGNIYYLSFDENISWITYADRQYNSGSKIPLNTKNGMEFSLSYMPLFEERTGEISDEIEIIVHNKGDISRGSRVRVCVLDQKGRLESGKWIFVYPGNDWGSEKIKVKPYYKGKNFYISVTDGAKEVYYLDKKYKGFSVFGIDTLNGNSVHIGINPSENSYYTGTFHNIGGDYTASAEKYINGTMIDSKTKYFIWVSKAQFKVNVFEGERGKWRLINSFPCSIGAKDTPTITGIFEYFQHQDRWTYPTYYVGPIMRFAPRGYAIHSVLMRYNGGFADGRVGKMISHGCVRMLPDDIKWLASTMPIGTRVFVTEE